MDLLSTIRKSGSRGGVNFSWDDVSTSAHRENYLGHSLKAPVGRWQKGRDLNWYAKAGDTEANSEETAEERQQRERKEEIKRIKEAEEDALNRALGLPVADRSDSGGVSSGANNIGLGEMKRIVGEADIEEGEGKGFGGFMGKTGGDNTRDVIQSGNTEDGGILGDKRKTTDISRRREDRYDDRRSERRYRDDRRPQEERRRSRSPRRDRRRQDRRPRSRSRSPYRKDDHRRRSRSPDRERHRKQRDGSRDGRRPRKRSRSGDRDERRKHRQRSPYEDRRGRRDSFEGSDRRRVTRERG